MKLLKKINNNYALAKDSAGQIVIVEGKGIGFVQMPCYLDNLSKISRTYYDATQQDVELIKAIPEDVMEVCVKIVDYVSNYIGDRISHNLTFILADHLQFCIERLEKHIELKMPLYYDITYIYPIEFKAAAYALKLIQEDLNITLPDTEKTGIALSIINAELKPESETVVNQDFVNTCVDVVEKTMNITIDKTGFNYTRFVTHLEYLSKRLNEDKEISSENVQLYDSVSIQYPNVRKCVDVLEQVLKKKNITMSNEEKLYLILHINRVCSREDCNR